MHMRLSLLTLLALAVAAVAATAASAQNNPATIPLPKGFAPEGIASGEGNRLWVGSLNNGAVWAGNARTGEGKVRVPGHKGRSAAGLKADDRGRLFVAGALTGKGYVYNGRNGKDVATYRFTAPNTGFVNDVVVTSRAAYFTDSVSPRLYVVPIDADGRLGKATTIALTGALVYKRGFNVNGIEASPDGRTLILAQTNTGKLFTADAQTGVTREIDLGGATVVNADGILLKGTTLYIALNRTNRIGVVKLAQDLQSGRVTEPLTDRDFDVPTTLASIGDDLFAVNARFNTVPRKSTEYDVVRIDGR
jgi:sugar lactone lactonase YvrE